MKVILLSHEAVEVNPGSKVKVSESAYHLRTSTTSGPVDPLRIGRSKVLSPIVSTALSVMPDPFS
jgi:hypothetical protein